MAVDALRREAQPNQAGPIANVAVEQNQAQVARAQIPPAQGEAPPQGIAVRPNMGKHTDTKQLIIYSIQIGGAALMTAAGAAGVAMGVITGTSLGGGALFGLYAGVIGQAAEFLINKAVDFLVSANCPTLRVIGKVALTTLAYCGAAVLAAMLATVGGFPVTSTLILSLSVAAIGVAINLGPWIHQAVSDAKDKAAENQRLAQNVVDISRQQAQEREIAQQQAARA